MDLWYLRHERRHGADVSDMRTGARRVTSWPDVEIGKHYRITDSSKHEEEIGEAIEQRESGFGHKWATLALPDGSREPVRTTLLVEAEATPPAAA